MRLSMLVNPPTDENLQLAAQVGVSDVVTMYPGPELAPLMAEKRRVESFGMRLTHIERKVPHDKIVHGLPGHEAQVENFKLLIRNMAEAEMEVLCYNWMPAEDWSRTTCEFPERGGSRSTAFDIALVGQNVTDADGRPEEATSAQELWDNLERFLTGIVPVAEDCGIKLALHPDDPPLPELWGHQQIMTGHEALERVVELVPSEANGICYCTGSLGPTGEDLVSGIRSLGERIHFAHVRNIRGTRDNFQETWHDNGDLSLADVIAALRESGFSGTIRPDHAPSMAGEANKTPGYEMKGKLFAIGYLRGLMDGTACENISP